MQSTLIQRIIFVMATAMGRGEQGAWIATGNDNRNG